MKQEAIQSLTLSPSQKYKTKTLDTFQKDDALNKMIEKNILVKREQEDKRLAEERQYKQEQLLKMKQTLDHQKNATYLNKKQEKLENISFGL